MDCKVGNYVLDDDTWSTYARDNHLNVAYTVHGDPVVTNNKGGKFEEALLFDGNDLAVSTTAWSDSFNSVKVEFWMYINALPSQQPPESGINYLMCVNASWELYLNSNVLYFRVYGPSSEVVVGVLSGNISEGVWHHVVAEYYSDKSMSLQIDSNLPITTTATNTMWQRSVAIQIGGRADKPIERGFTGLLDEVRISSPQNVNLVDDGNSITVNNSIIEATFNKSNGQISSIKKGNVEFLGNGGYGYFDNRHGINSDYYRLENTTCSVITNTAKKVELSFTRVSDSNMAFDIDLRYVFLRDVSGIYCYAIYAHDVNDPAEVLGETRFVLRLDKAIFDYIVVDDSRRRYMPTPEEFSSGTPLVPVEAKKLVSGEVEHKYDYSCMLSDQFVHGWCGSGGLLGLWIITASHEFNNGGPSKQILTAHQTETTPLILSMLHDAHYGGSAIEINENWEKLYGPFFIYINKRSSIDDLWNNAKYQASDEKSQWPYNWVNNRLYPTHSERGTVSGILSITDRKYSPLNAFVVLADGENENIPNWQQQGKNYIFWTQADANGMFSIKDVRPGSYTIYAYVDGIIDEFKYGSITVAGGDTLNLGTITWPVIKRGDFVWQIGEADRTASEYLHGYENHQWGLWYEYANDFPNDVNFVIGLSDYSTEWNYAQVLDFNDGFSVTPWEIKFNMAYVNAGQAFLIIPIASATSATLKVEINGVQILLKTLTPSDSAVPRDSMSGFYRVEIARFATTLLHTGTNTIRLTQIVNNTMFASIMYDCIRLEICYGAGEIAAWDMDSSFFKDGIVYVPDSDANDPGRNYDIRLNYPFGDCFISTIGQGYTGEALVLDGNDCAVIDNVWNGYDSVKLDLYFKADNSAKALQYIAYCSGVWQLYCSQNQLIWRIACESGYYQQLVQMFSPNIWNHIQVDYSEGRLSMTLNGNRIESSIPEGEMMKCRVGCGIVIGGNTTVAERGFDGMLDEVCISIEHRSTVGSTTSPADFNRDYKVDFMDLMQLVEDWLQCTLPNTLGCSKRYL